MLSAPIRKWFPIVFYIFALRRKTVLQNGNLCCVLYPWDLARWVSWPLDSHCREGRRVGRSPRGQPVEKAGWGRCRSRSGRQSWRTGAWWSQQQRSKESTSSWNNSFFPSQIRDILSHSLGLRVACLTRAIALRSHVVLSKNRDLNESIVYITNKHKQVFNILSNTTYNEQRTTNNVQRTTYNIQCTAYSVQHTTYNVQRTTYNLQRFKQLLSFPIFLFGLRLRPSIFYTDTNL